MYIEKIWRPSEEELQRMLFTDDKFKNLIPSHTLIADWKPFGLIPSNVVEICRLCIPYVSGDMDTLKALSLCGETPCNLGVRMDMHFYGETKDQLMLHVGNILRYFVSGQSFTDPDICVSLVVTVPESIPTTDLDKLAEIYGWKPGPFADISAMFLAEKS